MPSFELQSVSDTSLNRRGILHTAHGDAPTPFFMPIATKAAVKTLSSVDMEHLGSPIVLSNTFHLMLKPGTDVIEKAGGLHKFMGWNRSILTDSGGFQVYSLSKMRKVTEEGAMFQSPIDGSKQALTPESSIQIQRKLGSDIVMCFDDVIGLPAPREAIEESMERSLRWAKRSKEEFNKGTGHRAEGTGGAQLFGIIQGGTDDELRRRSTEGMLEIGFDGYAIGGLSVGEPFEDVIRTLELVVPMLPEDKPRYFMGGAQPDQIVEYVKRGIDMFDCVLPTRNARHGHLYRWTQADINSQDFYEVVNITNAKWKGSDAPLLDPALNASPWLKEELGRFTMGYLHHLFDTDEMLGYRLATIINLAFYLDLFERLRAS